MAKDYSVFATIDVRKHLLLLFPSDFFKNHLQIYMIFIVFERDLIAMRSIHDLNSLINWSFFEVSVLYENDHPPFILQIVEMLHVFPIQTFQ
uniref:Uncharacterized protein n=1 Tax=Onchocerca volvulus TaxID=6282 RepID=A0A8R1TK60_ONCVO